MTQKPAKNEDDLGVVLDALFGGERTDVPTKEFGKVQIFPAKVRQLKTITSMFTLLINRIPEKEFGDLLGSIAAIQKENIDAGRSPFYMADENAGKLLLDFLQGRSLIGVLLNSLADVLPEFLCQFTSLNEKEKYEELSIDEFAVIAAGVVAINYGFFTRQLLPTLKSVLQNWRVKKSKNS